jgi:hypothetical protein
LTRMPSFCWVFSFLISTTQLSGILELQAGFLYPVFCSFTLLLWVFKLYFKCETTFIIRKVGSYQQIHFTLFVYRNGHSDRTQIGSLRIPCVVSQPGRVSVFVL